MPALEVVEALGAATGFSALLEVLWEPGCITQAAHVGGAPLRLLVASHLLEHVVGGTGLVDGVASDLEYTDTGASIVLDVCGGSVVERASASFLAPHIKAELSKMTDSLPTKKADALPTTHVALSLTEDYCPSWGVWEGVRELIQNVHDGALESGGTSWSETGEDSFASGEAATITYDRARQRLVLINRSVGLQRRVLLLGSSQKSDSLHAIGQFGEGMKVGNLALLREGRRVEMLTGDEHWHWTRRVDDAFGVRVLTVEVSDRSHAAGKIPN